MLMAIVLSLVSVALLFGWLSQREEQPEFWRILFLGVALLDLFALFGLLIVVSTGSVVWVEVSEYALGA